MKIKVLIIMMFMSVTAFSQTESILTLSNAVLQTITHEPSHIQRTDTNYIDSLHAIKDKIFTSSNQKVDILNPYLYQLFGPGTYYKGVTRDIFSIDTPSDSLMADKNSRLMDWYMSFPKNFAYHDDQFDKEELIPNADETKLEKEDIKEVIKEVKQPETIPTVVEPMDINLKITKPNFWKTYGKFSLQFTQNYISDNWHKGGNNNGTMLASLYLEAKYDDTKKWTWENKLDTRLGFVTTSADTCHTFITNNDRLNLYSKLGLKSTKSWKYTLTAEGTSQFMPGYKTNRQEVFSEFLAPLDVNVSLGFDFNPSLKNGNSLSLVLLPLSYKFRYIHTDEQNIHNAFGQQTDFKQDWGSKIEFNTRFTLVKNLSWRCRFYCFTSYKYVESELENAFSYQLSKYISTELYTLWRFDDNRNRSNPDFYDRKTGYFQFKEYLTFGLAYSF